MLEHDVGFRLVELWGRLNRTCIWMKIQQVQYLCLDKCKNKDLQKSEYVGYVNEKKLGRL